MLGVALALLQQLSGINAVLYYGPTILERAGFRLGHALDGQVIIGLVNVLGTIVAVATVDRFGRRPLLLAGGCGILVFIACFSVSYGPVVWILLSEIFPMHVRGSAMSLATMALWLGTLFVGQVTPWLLQTIQPAGTFWLFAVCTSPVIYVAIWMLPETKGRSLEAIERDWLRA